MGISTPNVTLKVVEVRQRDIGRGTVRIDDINMRKLGITTGNVIEIQGHRKTGAIVWPAYIEDVGENIVRLDDTIRKNPQVKLGDTVIIRKAFVRVAIEVTIAPTRVLSLDYDFEADVQCKLHGYPVSTGDTILIPIFGRSIPFIVGSANPKGIVLITDHTNLKVSAASTSEHSV